MLHCRQFALACALPALAPSLPSCTEQATCTYAVVAIHWPLATSVSGSLGDMMLAGRTAAWSSGDV